MLIELWDIAIVLLGAKIGGAIFTKLRQPSSIGEILAGLFISYFITTISESLAVQVIANLGLIFLILLTVMSVDFGQAEKNIEKFIYSHIIIILLTSIILFGIMKENTIIFLACIIGSSTSIALRSLISIDAINSKEGQTILGMQLINTVVEVILISLAMNIIATKSFNPEIAVKLALMMVGTFVVTSRVGYKMINFIFNNIQRFKMEEVLLAFTIIFAFAAAAFTEKIGLTSLIGIMLMGILVSRTQQALVISTKVRELSESFFTPVFFASLGFGATFLVDLNLLLIIFFSLLALRLVMFILPVRLVGYSSTEAVRIGSGFLPMSGYGLMLFGLGVKNLIFDQELYSVFVISFILMNMISPLLIKLSFKIRPIKRRVIIRHKKGFI
ncbi:MAG: cation:proton antiporter [Candidatus Aenigmatarchaeota archaeon]